MIDAMEPLRETGKTLIRKTMENRNKCDARLLKIGRPYHN